jgi:hypothetical protein
MSGILGAPRTPSGRFRTSPVYSESRLRVSHQLVPRFYFTSRRTPNLAARYAVTSCGCQPGTCCLFGFFAPLVVLWAQMPPFVASPVAWAQDDSRHLSPSVA